MAERGMGMHAMKTLTVAIVVGALGGMANSVAAGNGSEGNAKGAGQEVGHAAATATFGAYAPSDAATARRKPLASAKTPTAETLLNWAERTYPQFFPGQKTTRSLAPYLYRYYPETGNYVGVTGTQVAILGPVSNGVLQIVGQLTDFACLVTPRDCVVPVVERVAASSGVTKIVLPDGRVGLLGEERYPVKYSGLYPNSVVKIVDGINNAVSIRSSEGFLSDRTVVLTAEGDVYGWGQGSNALGQTYSGSNVATAPVKVGQLSNVADVSLADGNMTMALKTDGTVWVLPGVVLDSGQVAAARVTELPKIRGIFPNGAGDYSATIAVDESGQVWSIKRASSVRDAANRRTLHPVTVTRMLFAPPGVQQIACTGPDANDTCLAVVADGSIKAWGENGGSFGDGTTQSSTLPVAVRFPSSERVRKLSLQRQCALALTESGKLYYWGLCYGVVPSMDLTLTPTAMYSGIAEFAVYGGSGRIVAVSTSGSVHSWGGTYSESLGDGRTQSSTTPIRVQGITLGD